MVFVTSMTFIDMTIVTIAAPDIERELGITPVMDDTDSATGGAA